MSDTGDGLRTIEVAVAVDTIWSVSVPVWLFLAEGPAGIAETVQARYDHAANVVRSRPWV